MKNRGFTLLEVVLALAMTVMVTALVASAMFTAFQTKNSVNDALNAARTNDVAAGLMVEELRNALPPTPVANATTVVLLPGAPLNQGNLIGPFEGTDDPGAPSLLDFYTTGPEPKADLQPDVREVQYALADADNGTKNLIRRVNTNLLTTDTSGALPPDVILARNVVDFTITYYDGLPDAQGTNTYTVWDSMQQNNTLPMAVAFTLTLASVARGGGAPVVTTRTIILPGGTDASLSTAAGTGATP